MLNPNHIPDETIGKVNIPAPTAVPAVNMNPVSIDFLEDICFLIGWI